MGERERIRLVLCDWGEGLPTVVGALSRTTWELFDDEEWARMRQKVVDVMGMHAPDYEIKEIEISLDRDALVAAISNPRLDGEIERGTDDAS